MKNREDRYSISRLGYSVRKPALWATFSIDVPNTLDEYWSSDELKTFFPSIRFAHPNPIFEPNSLPNDPLILDHGNLHKYDNNDFNHINIEPAWDMEVGQPFVKVGIIDNEVGEDQIDMGYSSKILVNESVKLNGTLISKSQPTLNGHGMGMASVIAALRNNNEGISGIAGGDVNGQGNNGVKLYCYDIYYQTVNSGFTLTQLNAAFSRLINIDQVNTINCSNGMQQLQAPNSQSDFELLEETIKNAFLNDVVVTASRGNEVTSFPATGPNWPATLHDDWIISVGASNMADGEYGGKKYGMSMDLVAPMFSPSIGGILFGSGSPYGNSSNSSVSSAQTNGVAALMLSYYNTPASTLTNLSMEDVEQILQKSATDVETNGYDQLTGWGRVNAGNALQFIDKDYYRIEHYETTEPMTNKILVSSNVTVEFTKDYIDAGAILPAGFYIANVYKVSVTRNHNLPNGTTIPGAESFNSWPRQNRSGLWSNPSTFLPESSIQILNIDQSSITLEGYVYEILHPAGNPGNTINALVPNDGSGNARFAWSIRLDVSNEVGIDEKSELKVRAFPNPTGDILQLIYPYNEGNIKVFDISGRKLLETAAGPMNEYISTQNWASGIYFVHFEYEDQQRVIKIIKNE